jgi:hypothetical protein
LTPNWGPKNSILMKTRYIFLIIFCFLFHILKFI